MNMRLIASALVLAGVSGIAFAQTALGPAMTSVSVNANGLMAALAANPSRRGVVVCNESTSGTLTVTTGTLSPVSLTTGRVLATGNLVTSCLTIGSTQGVPTSSGGSNVGAQINVIPSASPTSVTFIEYY
jgi:hypothetical protein